MTTATNPPDIHSVCVFSSIGLRIQAKSERVASFTISATICMQHRSQIKADSEDVLLPHIDLNAEAARTWGCLNSGRRLAHASTALLAALSSSWL